MVAEPARPATAHLAAQQWYLGEFDSRRSGGDMVANETELTYLVILIGLTMVIHLILAHMAEHRRNEKR